MILARCLTIVVLSHGAMVWACPFPWLAEETPDLSQRLQAAEEARLAGDLDRALELLRDAREWALDQELPLGEVSLQLGKLLYWGAWGPDQVYFYQEGLDHLYRSVQEEPQHREAALTLVDALLEERDLLFSERQLQSAESTLQRARDTLLVWQEDKTLPVRKRQARILMRSAGEEAKAYELSWTLLCEDPADPGRHDDFVAAVTRAKLHERGLQAYQTLETEPGFRDWYSARIQVDRANRTYNWQRDDSQALADYVAAEQLMLRAASSHPDFEQTGRAAASDARTWAGWTLVRLGRLLEAREAFALAGQHASENAGALDGLVHVAQLLHQGKDWDHAREVFGQACEIAPERADLWCQLAESCRAAGKTGNALEAYERALQLAPRDPWVLYGTARLLRTEMPPQDQRAGELLMAARDRSREIWEGAMDEFEITDALALYGDTLVELWRLYDDRGDMLRASAAINELREVDPVRPELPPVPLNPMRAEGES